MTTDEIETVGPAQFKALGHPTRYRLLYALDEPATISGLAARLDTNKGNIAHHLKVLLDAGLVHVSATRQVRGGTERYFERAARVMRLAGGSWVDALPAALGAVAEELAAAAPDPLLSIRHVRLRADEALTLRAALSALIDDVVAAGDDEPRYGVIVGLYEQVPTDR